MQPPWERELRSACSMLLFVMSTFFFSILVSQFSSAVFERNKNSYVQQLKDALPVSFAEYIDGLLPGLGLILFKNVAPYAMMFIVIIVERPSTRSQVEVSLMAYYYIFEFWNYFFVLSIASATSSGSYILSFVNDPVSTFHEFGLQFPRVVNIMMYYISISMVRRFALFDRSALLHLAIAPTRRPPPPPPETTLRRARNKITRTRQLLVDRLKQAHQQSRRFD